MTADPPVIDRRALAFGLAVLAIGVILSLAHLHLLPPVRAGALWPLLLVGLGVGRLLAPRAGHRRWPGAVLTLIGVWLLLDTLHVWDVPIDVAWSGALAIGGLAIVVDALTGVFAARRREP
jgi:hypothetical protein